MLFTRKSHGAKQHFPFMAPSLSSLLSNSTHPFLSANPNPILNHRDRRYLSISSFTPKATQKNHNITSTPPPPSPPQNKKPISEKRSFAVATGELFLGIASRLLNRSNRLAADNFETIPLMERSKRVGSSGEDYEERIGAVMEDDIEPGVIWEQRVKDIEAEKERRVVTSPGFSFSAAGLLFPYHLGVAQFLIEKGYIKVFCYVVFVFHTFFSLS